MILRAQQLCKSYQQSTRQLDILKGIDLSVEPGASVSIMGQSGSGKSTLISILAGLDEASRGELWVDGRDLRAMKTSELARFRARHCGVIFQQFHLLPHLTALENVRLPLDFTGEIDATKKSLEVLAQLGLSDRADHYPAQMSRGECQRVAIGRVLVMHPPIMFADEPTGSLDLKTADEIIQLIFAVARSEKIALIMATHDPQIAALCEHQYVLKGGQLSRLEKNHSRLATREDL
jgi:putative ABC transport system ATP-binding protein